MTCTMNSISVNVNVHVKSSQTVEKMEDGEHVGEERGGGKELPSATAWRRHWPPPTCPYERTCCLLMHNKYYYTTKSLRQQPSSPIDGAQPDSTHTTIKTLFQSSSSQHGVNQGRFLRSRSASTGIPIKMTLSCTLTVN